MKLIIAIYCLLYSLNTQAGIQSQGADLIVFSYDRPLQLYAFLESTYKYINELNSVTVIYRTSTDQFENAYQQIISTFRQVNFVRQSVNPNNFRLLTLEAIGKSKQYLLFAVDDIIVKDYIDLSECINYLEKSGAYGFYLKMGTNLAECYSHRPTAQQLALGIKTDYKQPVPRHINITDNICAWNFEDGAHDWNYPHTVDMTLYRTADIYASLSTIEFSSPFSLEAYWAQQEPLNKTGLFYTLSKIVNLPLNRVQAEYNNNHMGLYTTEELLDKFISGLKIDIRPLYKVYNNDVHWEYYPSFIQR